MAIHDFGYRGYQGERTGAVSRVLGIALSDFRQSFKSKLFLVFYVFCISPAIMAFVFVYLRFIVVEGQGQVLGMRGNRGLTRWLGMVDTVEFYVGRGEVVILTILFSGLIGAGVVARDRRAGALEIYFTRGIRPLHYVLGKFGGVLMLLLCQVLVPFLVVWLFGVAVASAESRFLETTGGFIWRVVIGQTFLCATLSYWLIALSSSTDSVRFALLRWVGGLSGLGLAALILYRIFGDPSWWVISPWKVTQKIAVGIAGGNLSPEGFELPLAWIGWAVLTAAATLWLRRHLRPVEVVA